MTTHATSRVPLSFEFFPPKTPVGMQRLAAAREQLYAWKPAYCSVTYGAGGSTQDGTLQIVREILAEGVDAAPHFSCIGATEDTVRERLAEFQAAGITRIVALRGDLPSGHGSFGAFRHASDLVAFIRQSCGQAFHIEVAAYPEMHPQARSPQADLQAFLCKVRAGANAALTQYFFNCDAYLRFVDEVRAAGESLPIIPGIMPITNSTQLLRFSDACGAEVPRWIRTRLESFGDDSASIASFGQDVVSELCAKLLQAGAPGLHFYTMNQATAVQGICESLFSAPEAAARA